MIEKSTIERIMDAQNIVDVIGDFYDLKKKGKEYQCLCPFHDDGHLGSFSVSPSKNIFHCFACGAHGNSVEFLMRHERLSYPDALRWLGRKYGIEVEGSERFTPKPCKPHNPLPKEEDLPILMMSTDITNHTRGEALQHDTLCNWLRALPWLPEQKSRVEMVLKNYGVGHSKDGRVIFWQIDENAMVRTGKLMRYLPDGHRDKNYHPGWIHNLLANAKHIDLSKMRKSCTLFGMHLLKFFPNADICLVESEKTALICAVAYGNMKQHLWMAAGGLQFLKPDMLEPIIKAGRHITLFPDRDGVSKWEELAQMLDYDNISINTDFVTKWWKPEDGDKADIADVIIRILADAQARQAEEHQPTKRDIVDKMCEANPVLKELISKFDLIEYNGRKQTTDARL